MPGHAHTGNHVPPVTEPAGVHSAQKMISIGKAIQIVACSHVRARYPQAGPQSLGASEKAASLYPQGFAPVFETFSLDPQGPAV
jgi:hypothetical protein